MTSAATSACPRSAARSATGRRCCGPCAGSRPPGRSRRTPRSPPPSLPTTAALRYVLGVAGGFMQPQAQVQLLVRMLVEAMAPQEAIDAARFKVLFGGDVAAEPGHPLLASMPESGERPPGPEGFGAAQVVGLARARAAGRSRCPPRWPRRGDRRVTRALAGPPKFFGLAVLPSGEVLAATFAAGVVRPSGARGKRLPELSALSTNAVLRDVIGGGAGRDQRPRPLPLVGRRRVVEPVDAGRRHGLRAGGRRRPLRRHRGRRGVAVGRRRHRRGPRSRADRVPVTGVRAGRPARRDGRRRHRRRRAVAFGRCDGRLAPGRAAWDHRPRPRRRRHRRCSPAATGRVSCDRPTATTWTTGIDGARRPHVHCLAVDGGDTLLAGTGAGVFRSRDGGATWSAANAGWDTPGSSRWRSPRDGSLLAGGYDGVWRSTDRAASWRPEPTGLTAPHVFAVAAGCIGVYGGTGSGLVHLARRGSIMVADRHRSRRGHHRLLRDRHRRRLGPCGTAAGCLISADGGRTWRSENDGLTHLDIYALVALPSGEIIAGTNGGGVFRSDRHRPRWTAANDGLADRVVHDLRVDGNGRLSAATSNLVGGHKGGGVYR